MIHAQLTRNPDSAIWLMRTSTLKDTGENNMLHRIEAIVLRWPGIQAQHNLESSRNPEESLLSKSKSKSITFLKSQ